MSCNSGEAGRNCDEVGNALLKISKSRSIIATYSNLIVGTAADFALAGFTRYPQHTAIVGCSNAVGVKGPGSGYFKWDR